MHVAQEGKKTLENYNACKQLTATASETVVVISYDTSSNVSSRKNAIVVSFFPDKRASISS
jgi:hypothetical protein